MWFKSHPRNMTDPLLEACKQHIKSLGVVLWRDWQVSSEEGLMKAAHWLANTIRQVINLKQESELTDD